MKAIRQQLSPQQRIARWRAASAVLLLLLGWLSAPVSWMASSPDVCAMSCCVESGHCCCAQRRVWVEGQDRSDQDTLDRAEIISSCPAECSSSALSSSLMLRGQTRTAAHAPDFFVTGALLLPRRTLIHNPFANSPSSPRAPPTFRPAWFDSHDIT